MLVQQAAFQSTLPVWGATGAGSWRYHQAMDDFNPRSPCGERLAFTSLAIASDDFNQRSPCGERHDTISTREVSQMDFNPRSPCGERPVPQLLAEREAAISIHAPRGGSDDVPSKLWALRTNFNPRSPCGERREIPDTQIPFWDNFNPRSPCGERRYLLRLLRLCGAISIHAPRVGSDTVLKRFDDALKPNFNPRSPCGERHQPHLLRRHH